MNELHASIHGHFSAPGRITSMGSTVLLVGKSLHTEVIAVAFASFGTSEEDSEKGERSEILHDDDLFCWIVR